MPYLRSALLGTATVIGFKRPVNFAPQSGQSYNDYKRLDFKREQIADQRQNAHL